MKASDLPYITVKTVAQYSNSKPGDISFIKDYCKNRDLAYDPRQGKHAVKLAIGSSGPVRLQPF